MKLLRGNESREIKDHCSLLLSHLVMSDFLWSNGLQHTRLLCPSPSPRAWSNSCPLSLWYHATISSSVIPFSYLQSFPDSGSFPMSQLFASGGQRIRASASASVLPMNIQDWFPLELTGLISLQSRGLSGVFSTPQFKSIDSSVLCLLYANCLENHFNDFLFRVLNMHQVRVPV